MPPDDPNIAIAVLYERLGHVILKLDDLGVRMDRQSRHGDDVIGDLDTRISALEDSVNHARWFLAGVAAGGGALGGAVATMLAQAIGG